ncbi:MAG: cysteine rich repeat-containing protein [Geminicoccaceae bacterium]
MRQLVGLALGAVLALAAAPGRAQEVRTIARACAGDIERLCAEVPPGEGRIKACMKAHIKEVSAPCFDALLGAIAAEKKPGREASCPVP